MLGKSPFPLLTGKHLHSSARPKGGISPTVVYRSEHVHPLGTSQLPAVLYRTALEGGKLPLALYRTEHKLNWTEHPNRP